MLAKSKLNSIEALVSQALIDMEISHEEFNMIMKEKKNTKRWKKNVRNMNKKLEEINKIMRLNSVNSRTWKK